MTNFEGKVLSERTTVRPEKRQQQTQQEAQQTMKKQQKQQQQDEKAIEKAQWMLEGSHKMTRDADAAVALLETKVKNGDAEAMWMLGVCCEFGMGTKQDVERAEQLYKRGAEQETQQQSC